MKKFKRFLKISGILTVVFLFVAAVSTALILEPGVRISGFSSLDKNRMELINKSVRLKDNSGIEVSSEQFLGSVVYTPLSSLKKETLDAFIAIEDKRFYEHKGVDYTRIISAIIKNLRHMKYKEGASTISQQLIKNTHLTNEKTMSRKVQEIRIARELERNYSKEQILEMYLNILYFGNNVYGIGSAAKTFFNKKASELELAESATLAGIINNPVKFSPYTNEENCISRRNLVLSQMLKYEFIDEIQYASAHSSVFEVEELNDVNNHYFSNAVSEASILIGCDTEEIYKNGYVLSTYYDKTLQAAVQQSIFDYQFENRDKAYIACLVLENKSSNVIAYAATGRLDYYNLQRQPGSTVKPVISYAPAFENRSLSPITPILDEKTSFGEYTPSNYKNNYLGWASVENCLVTSSNVAAVKLLEMNGIDYSKRIAGRFGYTFDKEDRHLALALGGMTKGLTLGQIANSYQVFANAGKYRRSSYIREIRDPYGHIIYEDRRSESYAVGEDTAFMINDILSKCAKEGTAKRLRSISKIAAKTGTVGTKDGNTDAYCISYTPSYTIAVWMGSKKGLMPNGISGGTYPAALNRNIVRASKIDTCEKFNVPDSITELDIDSGELLKNHKIVVAGEKTPARSRVKSIFSKNNLPRDGLIKYNQFILKKDEVYL